MRYDGPKGNAVAFADVRVRSGGEEYCYLDAKLYRAGNQLRLSPKQIRSESGLWVYAYEIQREFHKPIRLALIERLREETTGQLALSLRGVGA